MQPQTSSPDRSGNPAKVVEALEAGRADFLAATDGLTDADASVKPDPDRWSVLECIEHVVTVEGRFLGWVENGKPIDPAPDEAKEAALTASITDRSTKRQAPEAVQPTGQFSTLAEALAAFHAARDKTVDSVKTRGSALYSVQAEHPRFGLMNGAEVIILAAGHARRHASQIRETREAIAAGL